LLVVLAAVGDFVTSGQPVIAVFGDGSPPAHASRQLQRMVALGVERTVEQDPAFAVLIMADIAVKALSAAINDPTTAVQALDHLETVPRLLEPAGCRRLRAFVHLLACHGRKCHRIRLGLPHTERICRGRIPSRALPADFRPG
jgi:uncharacterized membrane protein